MISKKNGNDDVTIKKDPHFVPLQFLAIIFVIICKWVLKG